MVDVTGYQDGKRGGKVRVRARIEELDKKTLVIRDVPYGVTTHQLMESITKANDQGKIKIKKVTDLNAADIEIQIELAPGISTDITIDALYAFTDCEVSISPNACVIANNKPCFVTVSDLLRSTVNETRELLKQELEIKLGDLQDKWHFTSLEKIFFEEKIYKELEEKHNTWETVLEAIEKAFSPYKKKLKRPIERADILKLTEKPVRRIYRLDIKELNDQILQIEENIREVEHHLDNLTDYAVAYFENLLKKYGKERTRKTIIKEFDTIQVKQVAIANTKLYINRAEGFIGTGLKKDELLCECSDYDDIIAFTKAGSMKVVKVADKVFIGKDIIHAAVFRKNDERTTYNMIYVDGKTGISFAKRFNVTGVTRDKEYDLTKGEERSKVHYFSANANGEAESVRVVLSPASTARIKEFDFFFEELEIKGRSSIGNQVTKYSVKSIRMKEAGRSTLAGIKLWFDDKFGRLNTEGKGKFLGTFEDEKIIVFNRNGTYEITDTEQNQRFEPEQILLIEKYQPDHVISAVYLDQEKKQFNVKRFVIETTTLKTPFSFIKEGAGNYLMAVSTQPEPLLIVTTGKGQQVRKATFKIAKMVEVTGWKTVGTKLTEFQREQSST
jgi:topoisomerase-4 subunit A